MRPAEIMDLRDYSGAVQRGAFWAVGPFIRKLMAGVGASPALPETVPLNEVKRIQWIPLAKALLEAGAWWVPCKAHGDYLDEQVWVKRADWNKMLAQRKAVGLE